ncbi:hypothetical protein L6R53_09105 [Myxococcota bacterium]|nr:hypothetical protein [Myxococcota bacterium]
MTSRDDWEEWLADAFPGFLLPDSMHRAIPREVAARFLARLGRPDHLRVLQGSALFSPPDLAADLRTLVHELVPRLVEALPSQTEVYARRWEEGFQGRLDVRATLSERLAGNPGAFVTRARRRSYDLPETVLLKHVLTRLGRELARLRDAGLLPGARWSGPIDECEHRIDAMLEGTVLRHVIVRPVEASDLVAARAAREPAYRAAEHWLRRLRVAFDEPQEAATAALLAQGALAPASADTRFEIAVILRLVGALWTRVTEAEPGRWALSHGLIRPGRRDIAALHRDDGASVVVFYNQVVLPPGPRDSGAACYFGSVGRIRPDWTVGVAVPGTEARYVVGEIKHTTDGAYERTGFSEAVLYRFEYGEALSGWLKSVLTVPCALPGKARPGDPTIAVGWPDWVPRVVVDGILAQVIDDVTPPSEASA